MIPGTQSGLYLCYDKNVEAGSGKNIYSEKEKSREHSSCFCLLVAHLRFLCWFMFKPWILGKSTFLWLYNTPVVYTMTSRRLVRFYLSRHILRCIQITHKSKLLWYQTMNYNEDFLYVNNCKANVYQEFVYVVRPLYVQNYRNCWQYKKKFADPMNIIWQRSSAPETYRLTQWLYVCIKRSTIKVDPTWRYTQNLQKWIALSKSNVYFPINKHKISYQIALLSVYLIDDRTVLFR